jgi:type IV secretory pathway VirB10-like protein
LSSVLKALQRLEKQRSFEEISNRSDLNTVDVPTVIRRQARRNHRSRRRRLIGLIVLVIGIGVLFVMAKTVIQQPRPDVAGTSPRKTLAVISDLTIVPKIQKPVFVSDAHPPNPTAPISRTESPTTPVKKNVLTGKEDLAALKPAPPSRTVPKSDRMMSPVRKTEKAFHQKTKTIPQREDARKSQVTLKPAKPDKHIKPPKRENLKAKSSQPIPSEAPEELALKLQAITWLNNPEKRFTVINGGIIRLGGMVDGFRLMRIEKDQVTVEKDNRKWLLKFNRMDYSNVTP